MYKDVRYNTKKSETKNIELPYFFEEDKIYPNDIWSGKIFGRITEHTIEIIEFRGMFHKETECVLISRPHENSVVKEDWVWEDIMANQDEMKKGFEKAKAKAIEFITRIN